jgi:hypothetical protein
MVDQSMTQVIKLKALPHTITALLAINLSLFLGGFVTAADEVKPHAVIVVGTLHYSPELTMPVFAKELERFGFRTTIVMGEGNPEQKTENVLPGIEARAR